MDGIIKISEKIKNRLPKTYEILKDSNLTVHPYVYKVILTGSRGLAGNYRPDSDIDLSLLVDIKKIKSNGKEEVILKEVLDTTMRKWKGKVELDTAAVFDINNCNLKCLNYEESDVKDYCSKGTDCIGLYKLQKEFSGYVSNIGIDIKWIYPLISVWERKE
ncbi:hypothetical protein [Caldisalinibacter kiritimatiensis]|uniref:Polymerase nucleotidyl transferase domain-containing protein n=1 Tax=Caldisalinibacter kiritimatiensis TaxID=1304284 RepID=R1AR93_9FIRM|nr:hypothetical protein [Caldisalinibacter kiritimatiensis]EOC99677.1 hypothetical protein L21TH_2320 [Caldisalinibacter kiritimatiensis]